MRELEIRQEVMEFLWTTVKTACPETTFDRFRIIGHQVVNEPSFVGEATPLKVATLIISEIRKQNN